MDGMVISSASPKDRIPYRHLSKALSMESLPSAVASTAKASASCMM
jgi:hypothetical protein